MTTKYVFSGHESFPCKQLWLKKGFDYLVHGYNFNAPDAVVRLGVGKNMVSSIRFWMKAFAMTQNDKLTDLAYYLLDDESGVDPFMEDLGTLWLLHFMLVFSGEATIYNWLFLRIQKERKEFSRSQILTSVHRYMIEAERNKAFNENTVKKDIGVLLQNYVRPIHARSFEEYTSLLLDLDLIRSADEGKSYQFNLEGKFSIPLEIYVYALLKRKGEDQSLPFSSLQDLGLVFCLTDLESVAMLRRANDAYPEYLHYSDVAGVRQIQFTKTLSPKTILDKYYHHD
ncbi:DUF4007 family protein [Prevotella sp. AGR2160]|uniref:DUF4007 family protein n=1 Tax=Prevotella sp. AGR2160 TaxID=1280674 RepID=UPI000407ED41|nr:DUF4007 family protein [Prevotella sp. AGR2160]